MSFRKIDKLIIECISGKRNGSEKNKNSEITIANRYNEKIWKIPNSKDYYDICITYSLNKKEHTKIFMTQEDLEDSINFTSQECPKFSEKKIDCLVKKIKCCLNKGGSYELILIENDGFTVVPLCHEPVI